MFHLRFDPCSCVCVCFKMRYRYLSVCTFAKCVDTVKLLERVFIPGIEAQMKRKKNQTRQSEYKYTPEHLPLSRGKSIEIVNECIFIWNMTNDTVNWKKNHCQHPLPMVIDNLWQKQVLLETETRLINTEKLDDLFIRTIQLSYQWLLSAMTRRWIHWRHVANEIFKIHMREMSLIIIIQKYKQVAMHQLQLLNREKKKCRRRWIIWFQYFSIDNISIFVLQVELCSIHVLIIIINGRLLDILIHWKMIQRSIMFHRLEVFAIGLNRVKEKAIMRTQPWITQMIRVKFYCLVSLWSILYSQTIYHNPK